MTKRFEARESVGYQATWTIGNAGEPLDITDWEFEADFERQAGSTDFSLGMALSPSEQGFRIVNGEAGQLSVNILPGTLAGIDDTTGLFTLASDLLATPPGSARLFLAALHLTVTKGPTA